MKGCNLNLIRLYRAVAMVIVIVMLTAITSVLHVNADGKLTVYISNIVAKPGDEISLPIYLKNVPSSTIGGANFYVSYKSDKFTYDGVEVGDNSVVADKEHDINYANIKLNSYSDKKFVSILYMPYDVSASGENNIKSDGLLCNIKFKVGTGTSGNYKFEITKVPEDSALDTYYSTSIYRVMFYGAGTKTSDIINDFSVQNGVVTVSNDESATPATAEPEVSGDKALVCNDTPPSSSATIAPTTSSLSATPTPASGVTPTPVSGTTTSLSTPIPVPANGAKTTADIELSSPVKLVLKPGDNNIILNDNDTVLNAAMKDILPVIYDKDKEAYLPVENIVDVFGGIAIPDDQNGYLIKVQGRISNMWLDKNEININGCRKKLPGKPVVINGNTYIPLDYTATIIGCIVEWNKDKGTVTILKR